MSFVQFSLESGPSDGATQASARVTLASPFGGGVARFAGFDSVSSTVVPIRWGILDGGGVQWFIQTSLTARLDSAWGFAAIAPNVTLPDGARTLFWEPNAALALNRRLILIGVLEGA